MKYERKERRSRDRLTDEEVEAIALKVKELALAEIYADIGKGVVKRILWVLGLGGSGLVLYLSAKGYIK